MEKTEDFNVLELQELALRHKADLPRKSFEDKCMIERLSSEHIQQKQGFRENDSTFARVKD
jgi:hypothetical protein